MSDSKYDRLFTRGDINVIIQTLGMLPSFAVVRHAIDECDEKGLLTFPADEPLFLLRGQDKAIVPTISSYATIASRDPIHASVAHCDAARQQAQEIHEWQQANPEKVKVPDTEVVDGD
jgi:hypothetical protein